LTTAPPPDIALQHLVLGICPSDDFQCTLNEAGHSILLSNNLTMCVERELSRHNPSIPVARSPRRCALVRLIFLPLNTPFRFLEAEFVFFLQPVDFFLCVTALCNGLAVPSYWCGGMHEASGLPVHIRSCEPHSPSSLFSLSRAIIITPIPSASAVPA